MNHAWPKALVLDLDGTLVDSSPDVAAAANQALAPVGIAASRDDIRAWLGDGARALIVKALRAHQVAADEDRIDALTAAFVAAYEADPVVDTCAFPGAVEALAAIHARGVGIAVCTNKPEAIARPVLEGTGFGPYVDTLAGGGAHRLKPDPEGLWSCLTALGVSVDDAVYIGDHAVDVATARAAGVLVAAAEFGYSQDPVTHLGADAVLASWQTLESVLAELAEQRTASEALPK